MSKVKCKICGEEFEQINHSHLKKHGIIYKEYCDRFPDAPLISEELRKQKSEKITGKTPTLAMIEGRKKHSIIMKGHPKEDYEHLNRTGLTKENDESVRRGAETYKETCKNPTSAMIEGRRRAVEKMIGRTKENNEGYKNQSEKMTGKVPTEKMIKGHKKAAKKMTNKVPTQTMIEGHKKQGKKMKGRTKENDEGKRRMSEKLTGRTGEQCVNWKGGISFEPYCEKFDNNFKNRVREFFNCCCYVCGKNEEDNKRKLDVHHVNYDKMMCCNDVKPLFVPLCRRCHGRTHGDREYWEEFFTVSLEYLTNGKCFYGKEELICKNNSYKKYNIK